MNRAGRYQDKPTCGLAQDRASDSAGVALSQLWPLSLLPPFLPEQKGSWMVVRKTEKRILVLESERGKAGLPCARIQGEVSKGSEPRQ